MYTFFFCFTLLFVDQGGSFLIGSWKRASAGWVPMWGVV